MMTDQNSRKFYTDDLYKFWSAEDSLINQRVTWYLQSASILFAANAVLLSGDGIGSIRTSALKIISFIGIALSVVIIIGIGGAAYASCLIHRKATTGEGAEQYEFGISKVTSWLGWAVAGLVPMVFLLGFCLFYFMDLSSSDSSGPQKNSGTDSNVIFVNGDFNPQNKIPEVNVTDD